MNKENSIVNGYIDITVKDKNGVIKDHSIEKNVIADVGLPELVKLIGALSGAVAYSKIAVGSGTTAENRGQTTLVTELTDGGFARATATMSAATYSGYVANAALLFEYTFIATASRTVAEIGLFNGTPGVMLARKKLTTAKPLDADETITIKYYIVLGDLV